MQTWWNCTLETFFSFPPSWCGATVAKSWRDPIRVPTLSLRRGAPFMHIKRKEGLKILEMGDYVRQRVTHMTGIIVPIFSLFNLSILAKVYSNIPTWTLHRSGVQVYVFNWTSCIITVAAGTITTQEGSPSLSTKMYSWCFFAYFSPIQLGASQSQIKGGSSIFVEIILHQEFSLYLLNLEVLGRPDMPSPMMSNSRASLNRIFI